MKKINSKKLIPAFLVLLVLFVIPFHGSDKGKIDYSNSSIQFAINGTNLLWGYTPECFASLQSTKEGSRLTLMAGDKVYNDTVRILLDLPGKPPWEILHNSSKIVILYAGRTYQGFVTVFLDDPIPEVGGLVTGVIEDCTLTWIGMDTTISIGPAKFSLVRVQ